MVKKIIHLFSKEISGLHQAAYVLTLFTLISQILGITRDRILAHIFGAGNILDIYYAAFRIPDLILVTAASVVSISVLVPFLSRKMKEGEAASKNFINHIFTSFAVFIILISAAAFVFAPFIVKIAFPGINDQTALSDLIMLTRILLLSPILLGFSNLLASIVQTMKRFFIYAICPVFYNIGIIAGILFFYPTFGIKGLAYGAILGAFMHLAIQIPTVVKAGLLPAFSFPIDFGLIKNVILTSLPRALALSANQIAVLFLLSLASLMHEGSISVFNFSNNLQSVPLSLIGVSYSLAAFPMLSKFFEDRDMEKFREHLFTSARHIIFWSLPFLTLFIVLRAQIVRTALGSGAFDWSDTRLTAASLAIFVISVVAQGLVLLFMRAHYAAGNTKKPLIISITSAISIVVLSFALVNLFYKNNLFKFFIESLFKVEGIEGTSVLMLSLAYSIGFILNIFLFWIASRKDFGAFPNFISKTFFQSFCASIITGFFAYKFLDIFDNLFNINTLFGIFTQGFLSGIIGVVAGILVLKLLNNLEIMEIWSSLRGKIWKVDIVVAEKVEL